VKGWAEKPQQIVLKMENLDQKIRKELVMAFVETVNMNNDEVNPEEDWNWIQNVCEECLLDSSEGLCANITEIVNEKKAIKLQ
jgi:hypothetical protein